ncbi:MAG TPA: hypothetical protein VF950_10225 [Planctomycetota bacterium]
MLHSFARIVGHGLAVLPFVPFRATRTGPDLDVEHGALFARVIPFEGGYKSKCDQNTASLYQVVEISGGPVPGDWRVETMVFRCAWPEGFELASPTRADDEVPFYLQAPGGACLYIRDAGNAPPLADLRAPDQTRVAIGPDFVEFAYRFQGAPWRQRHARVELEGHPFMISLQAPEAGVDALRPAFEEVRGSFESSG